MDDFAIVIKKLIYLMHEGDYWDFKKQWHADIIELLHDIICMANCQACGDKYIIIGVDESKNYKICGVKKNDVNRKNTSELNNFLRNKNFVGDIRPLVRVENIAIENKILDVIVVEDSNNVPFILAEDYQLKTKPKKYLRQGNIYTRVGDSNTPIDKTADNDKAESLWRRRFCIDKTPKEKILFYLQNPNDWGYDEDKENFYYKYAPEYTIFMDYEQEERESDNDFLCKMYIDNSSSYSTAKLNVYGSTIKEIDYVFMDGGRFPTIRPISHSIIRHSTSTKFDSLYMTYMNMDEIEFAFYNFIRSCFGNETVDQYRLEWWQGHVILFKTDSERISFEKYVLDNFQEIYEKADKLDSHREVVAERSSWLDWEKGDDIGWRQTKTLVLEYEKWKNIQQGLWCH